MREPYSEGVADHTGPESCAGDREVAGETWTGVHAGRALSPENAPTLECRRCWNKRKATPSVSTRQETLGLHGVVDLWHAWRLLARSLGDPISVLLLVEATGPWREAMSERRQ